MGELKTGRHNIHHPLHCEQYLRDSWICFDQTFLGLGLGKLFPARESLVSDIPAGDKNTAKPFFTVCLLLPALATHVLIPINITRISNWKNKRLKGSVSSDFNGLKVAWMDTG